MEPCDWLLANEEVSRLSGDCGGVMRLGLLHSECERDPGFRGRIRFNIGVPRRQYAHLILPEYTMSTLNASSNM